MWRFLHRQFTYFTWGFAVALIGCIAYAVGVSELAKYAAISAAAGLVVSIVIFFLERRFPEQSPPPPVEQ